MKVLSFAPAYLVPMVATLLGIYVLTRILPPEQYGAYAFVISLVTLGQAALFSWLDIGTKRFHERLKASGQSAVLNMTVYLGMGVSTVILLLVCVVGFELLPFDEALVPLLWIGAAVTVARQLAQVSKMFELAALSRTRYIAMECGESLIGTASGLALCWYAGFGGAGILWGMLAGAVTVVLFDLPRTLARLRGGRFDPALQRQIMTFSTPIAACFLLEYVMASSDRLLVQYFLGADALGLYAVSYSIAERAVTAAFLAVAVASYPLLVRAFEREGPEAARGQALSNAEILVAVALPAWGGFTVAAQHIAVVIVGPDYSAKAAQLMPLIGFAILLHAMRAHYFAHALHLTGNTVGLLLGALPAALVNVALNLWLMPSFGLVGAAWASIIAYSLALLVSVWQARRQFAMPFPLRETCKAAGATGMMCLVLHALHFPTTAAGLLGLIATGGAAYLAMVAAFDIGGLRSKAMILRRRLTVRPVG